MHFLIASNRAVPTAPEMRSHATRPPVDDVLAALRTGTADRAAAGSCASARAVRR